MRSPLPEVALVLGGLLGVLGAFAASRARMRSATPSL
jgi:hypothetical protein